MTDATTTPASQASSDTTSTATSASSQATVDTQQTTQPSGSATSQTQSTPGSDPWAGLDADNLSIVQNKKWDTPNAAIKAYGELERAYSMKSANTDVPTDVSGYDFGEPGELPEGFEYSQEFEAAFKDAALKGKMPKTLAKGVRDWFVEYSKAAHLKQIEARDNAITQSKIDLGRKWGPEEGPTFTRNVELANRAVQQLGLGDHLVNSGALFKGKDGKLTVVQSAVVEAFAKVGQAMFAEDGLYGDSSSAVNPWAKDSENATMQARIFKENPQKAKAMILASGRAEEFQYLLSKIG